MEHDELRNPAAEAAQVAGSTWRSHVLEPSPPASRDPDWFADDPLAPQTGSGSELVPAGVHRQDATSWSAWLNEHSEHAAWVAERWLGGQRSLGATPTELTPTRLALHRLAAYVVAPLRHQSTGKFGLRWTRGGFGTPFFADDRQVRIEGGRLIDQHRTEVRSAPITTLRAAAEFLGTEIDAETAAEHDSPPLGDVDETLAVDAAASTFLGDWFGMGFAALEAVRSDPTSINPSRPQLWPGHFDPAIEVGTEDTRASYGASPGDQSIDEPYLYVSVWWPDRLSVDNDDPAWNAPSFFGSVLRLSDFGPGDPAELAAAFYTSTRDRLHA